MLADDIAQKSVPGAVAELGVYKGAFAQRIRSLFPGRKFYLFDTFEGFSDDQKGHDVALHNASPSDFTDTSVELVLKAIGDTDLCIVKKGLFPETAHDVDDTFSFVSLDADLYEPQREGLNFFYDRLSPGGYIMVHDFQSPAYPGCRVAVEEFCAERKIPYVPIPDRGHSAVIAKP